MAVFRPTNSVCELNFDDKYKYTLPLHEDVADKIDRAYKRVIDLNPSQDRAGIDEVYNTALDVIDEILGEGSSENVMSIFEHPGVVEAIKVITFIANEYTEAYGAEFERMKTTANLPSAPNREQRRAAARR